MLVVDRNSWNNDEAQLWKKPIELIDIDKRSNQNIKANAKLNFVSSFIKVKKGNGLNITNEFK